MADDVVELDSRRRLALGKMGDPAIRHYLVSATDSGVITLTPAVVLPAVEVERLRAKAGEK
ncbi:MAG TPA: hypothetical protein VK507_04185 [Iamia sp.]|nr:hypothetical protein [Iamia sp.]